MDPYVGEIRLVPFDFAPQGWNFCDGSLLSISEFEVLYVLIGTTYGGNGTTNFAVPDLRGRAAMHMNSSFPQGMLGGAEAVTISGSTMASHSHPLQVSSAVGAVAESQGNFLASSASGLGYVYGSSPNAFMNTNSVSPNGSGQAHTNMQPYLALNYIISLFGIFPSQG